MPKSDESFSFATAIAPGLGNRHALVKDLALRQARERASSPPRSWLYYGIGDYMLAHGKSYGGRVLPDAYEHLRGPETECHPNSIRAAQQDRSLRYFTGFYLVGLRAGHHSWCMDAENNVVEVTYPTKDVEPGTITSEVPGGPGVPWLPPAHWAYFGLEFNVDFVQALLDHYGFYLPILDDHTPFQAAAMSHAYTRDGWPIT